MCCRLHPLPCNGHLYLCPPRLSRSSTPEQYRVASMRRKAVSSSRAEFSAGGDERDKFTLGGMAPMSIGVILPFETHLCTFREKYT